MKISIYRDAGMQTLVMEAIASAEEQSTIEVTDEEWAEFKDTEDHYAELLRRFEARLDTKRQEAESEIGQLRARLSQLESRVGVAKAPAPVAAKPLASKPHDPVSETDWGMGVGGREKPMAAGDFREELAGLRDRTVEKRAKRGAG